MRDHDISQRRACRLVGVDPKTVRRTRPPDCPEIREEMKDIAGKRRRFGVLLERKGMIMNHKKLYRLYREEGLSVKRRRGRKRARGTRKPMPQAARPNARWSLDFLADSFGGSRKFRILAVIDDCCRENLCLIADTSISGARVARELDALVRIYGKPACIVSDNGTEFTSRAILRWADQNAVPWHYIDPGKPQQNAFIRVVQRQPARRASERGDLRYPGRRPPEAGALALRLQHRQAAFIARQPSAARGAPDA
jgi:Transposase and inactivated derivatives